METSSDTVVRDGTFTQQQMHLLDTGLLADCTFIVGLDGTDKQTVRCHKLMLSKSSPVFYAMFNGELAVKGKILVDDIKPNHFRKLLQYIYADIVDLEDVKTALGVCYAAHKYLIKFLEIKCVAYIKEHLSAGNVCQALEFFRLVSNQELEHFCIQFIKSAADKVLAPESLQQVNRTTLISILKLDDLNVSSELSLFSACLNWAEANQQEGRSLRDTLGSEVLSHIRFRTLTSVEFDAHVCPAKILTSSEEKDILRCLTVNTALMPAGFSNDTRGRVPHCIRHKLECLIFGVDHDAGKQYSSASTRNFSLSFSLNTNIVIHGFVMRAWRCNTSGSYPENVTTILKQGNTVVASVKYEGQVSHGSFINVYLSKPVIITAGKYNLTLMYANSTLNYYSVSHNGGENFILNSGVTFSSVSGNTQICGIMLTPEN